METKRYKSSLFSLIAFVGFISCGQPSVVYEPPLFPERRHAAVEVLNDTYLFRYANQPAFYDSLLNVADMSEEAGICLFNRYDGRLVKAFGRKGNGPGELVTPVGYSVDAGKGYLYVNDYGRKSIYQYDLNRWENGLPVGKEIKLTGVIGGRDRILHVKDSLFIAKGWTNRLLLGTPDSLLQKTTPRNPDSRIFDSDKDWYAFMSQSCEAVSPSGDLYVAATLLGGILEITPIQGNALKAPIYRYFYEPVFKREQTLFQPTAETILGFCHLSVTDRHIYATAHGKKNPTSMPTDIWQFDRSGKPLAVYACGIPIENFTVDEEAGQIYAVAYNEADEQMMVRITMAP